jgi:hypothetical protein
MEYHFDTIRPENQFQVAPLRKLYSRALVQRDPCTSLWTKHLFSVMVLFLVCWAVAVSIGVTLSTDACRKKAPTFTRGFQRFSYFNLSLAGIGLLSACYVLVRWKYFWMKGQEVLPPLPLGEDIEDNQPFILEQSGFTLGEDALNRRRALDLETSASLDQMENQEQDLLNQEQQDVERKFRLHEHI